MDKTLQRIQSIDVLRGIIMIFMALDHTRDFFHIDAMTDQPENMDTTTPALFFTRWITHFCAPLFVFLSGTSIYLQSLRKTKKELALFLLTRGLWLIVAEFTIVGFGWSFNYMFNFFFLQVIWAIGASMVLLSGLIFLRYWMLFALGILITVLHNLLDTHTFTDPIMDVIANLFLLTEFDMIPLGGGVALMCAYAAVPWTGIMLLGYALGKWYRPEFDQLRRRKLLLSTGLGIISLFVLLRLVNGYGDPKPWTEQKDAVYTFLSFLNVNKYPPSLIYACMTLGPAMIALALLENVRNRVTDLLNVFGRVPFLYYLLHVYVIHLLCVGLFYAEGYTFADNFRLDMAFGFRPKENFGFPLGIVYLIWILVIVLCWFPTKQYEKYKRTHKKWWLSYV
ncbi:DUF1624 domain-containing protein [Flavobacterium sp.]|uniref:DUF1624 domain-containing protein n=1 Tax=Flavobacterium sp. TaxID=239 RepID=UPI0040334453